MPRSHSEEITVDGEADPVTVKPGVWVFNTRAGRGRLTPESSGGVLNVGEEGQPVDDVVVQVRPR